MSVERRKFRRILKSHLLLWKAGLVMASVVRSAGWAFVIVCLYGVLDGFIAFGPESRIVMGTILAAGLVVFVGLQVFAALRLSLRDAAVRDDQLLGGRRRPLLSAWELMVRGKNGAGMLSGYLSDRSVAYALVELERLTSRKVIPFRELAVRLKVSVFQLCILLLIVLFNPGAARVVAGRLLFPMEDIPPYSSYSFNITPSEPSVIYGGDVEIGVRIAGAPVDSQVWLLTRHVGKIRRAACFQKDENSFAQRLEKLVVPVDFCFTVGKARSRWHGIRLLLQPQIVMAAVDVTPPRYSRLPARKFYLGSEQLSVLKNSKVKLSVISNRPLLDGLIRVEPVDAVSEQVEITGDKVSENTVSFEWIADTPAVLCVSVRDLMGTGCSDPLRITQEIVPDNAPEISVGEPQGFVLATPGSIVPVSCRVADDLGVRRVDLVRTMSGYRDRMKSLGPDSVSKTFEFSGEIDLGAVGVEPGQTMEVYFEALDTNPSLLGVGSTDLAKIQIISEEDYAAMLRARTSFAEVMARYREIESAVSAAVKSLKILKDACDSNAALPDRVQALETARRNLARASRLTDALADDFPLYDMEKGLIEKARGAASDMRRRSTDLLKLSADSPAIGDAVEKMMREMGEYEAQVGEETQRAEKIESVAGVLECAAEFKAVVAEQRDIERKLRRFRDQSAGVDVGMLRALGERQKGTRLRLLRFKNTLVERASLLGDEYASFRESALEFATRLEQLDIPRIMARGVTCSENQDGAGAHHQAELALERLQEMVEDPCSGEFGGACECELRFGIQESMRNTVQQMLDAMMSSGRGTSGPRGMVGVGMAGGDADDGYSMGSHSALNIPMYGPERSAIASGPADGRKGMGDGSCDITGCVVDRDSLERLDGTAKEKVDSRSMQAERIPEKYRDAVIRYLTPDEH